MQDNDTVRFYNILDDRANVQAVLNAASMNCRSHDNVNDSTLESKDGDKNDNAENAEDLWNKFSITKDYPVRWTLIHEELAHNGWGLMVEEMLGEDFEQEAANNGEYISSIFFTSTLTIEIDTQITESDMAVIHAFQFKHKFFLSQGAFKALQFVFPHSNIPSIDRIQT